MVASGWLPSARGAKSHRSPCGAGESFVWTNTEVARPRAGVAWRRAQLEYPGHCVVQPQYVAVADGWVDRKTDSFFGPACEVFGDDTVAAALTDRLVHHAEVVSRKGDSYRMRGRDIGRFPTFPPPTPGR
jgi:hypothetical protein